MELIQLDKNNRHFISDFLKVAGKKTLERFRYFKSRSVDVLDDHLVTFVIRQHEETIGYGHLDKENETVWLGIAIAEKYHGYGLGKLMMQALLSYARLHQVPKIKLSVDKINKAAIPLYEQLGFEVTKEGEEVLFMEWGEGSWG